jgi:antitoxin component YwqK of YwqJK toxin-antitoxin module
MRPAALPAAAFNQLYNFSAEVGSLPPAIKAVEVRWNFDDGSDEFSFYRTYPNGPPQPAVYTVNHRFTQGSKRAFNVSFSLRDRVLDRILAQGSCPVGIASGTRITLSPPVLYATAGATVSFAPELFDPPTTPQLTWNFGDSSGPQTTSSLTVAHPYAGADTYTVSVELADAASPAAVLARATCRVEISALPTDEPCPCTCGTGLNYSALERVQNWTNGETLEEYYIDGAGRKQGLYKVFSSKDGGNQYLWQCRCYVDDRLEGWWFWYHDNGAKSSEEYYVNGMRNGPWRGWSRGGSLLWESTWVNDAKEGHEVLKDDDGTVLIDQDWPVAHPDGPFVEHWPSGDNVRKEECTFAGGRRQGLYSYWSAAGVLLLRGEFAAGLKTGDWTYYRADGTSQTINYGNQP